MCENGFRSDNTFAFPLGPFIKDDIYNNCYFHDVSYISLTILGLLLCFVFLFVNIFGFTYEPTLKMKFFHFVNLIWIILWMCEMISNFFSGYLSAIFRVGLILAGNFTTVYWGVLVCSIMQLKIRGLQVEIKLSKASLILLVVFVFVQLFVNSSSFIGLFISIHVYPSKNLSLIFHTIHAYSIVVNGIIGCLVQFEVLSTIINFIQNSQNSTAKLIIKKLKIGRTCLILGGINLVVMYTFIAHCLPYLALVYFVIQFSLSLIAIVVWFQSVSVRQKNAIFRLFHYYSQNIKNGHHQIHHQLAMDHEHDETIRMNSNPIMTNDRLLSSSKQTISTAQ